VLTRPIATRDVAATCQAGSARFDSRLLLSLDRPVFKRTVGVVDTFIQIALDCPAKAAVAPAARGEKKSIAVLEFELLSGKPYFYTQEELQFEVHLRHKGITASRDTMSNGQCSNDRAQVRTSSAI